MFHQIMNPLVVVIGSTVGSVLAVSLLWRQTYVLILILLTIAYFKHQYLPLKNELTLFIIGGVIGAMAESLMMRGGPWSYAQPELLNFPLWLPFLWGLAASIGATLYEKILKR